MNTQMNGNNRQENNNSRSNETNSAYTTENNNNPKLNEFFKDQLKDIYWAEKKLVTTLPKMQNASANKKLKNAFSTHLEQTKKHVERLEKVFDMIGEKAEAEKCPAMAGIVNEGENLISGTDSNTPQRDLGLIFAGQKAEHYEIATYGGLVFLAKTLGKNDVADLLHKNLTEEKDANRILSEIAERSINFKENLEPVEA